jgi:hypothetical protein
MATTSIKLGAMKNANTITKRINRVLKAIRQPAVSNIGDNNHLELLYDVDENSNVGKIADALIMAQDFNTPVRETINELIAEYK